MQIRDVMGTDDNAGRFAFFGVGGVEDVHESFAVARGPPRLELHRSARQSL